MLIYCIVESHSVNKSKATCSHFFFSSSLLLVCFCELGVRWDSIFYFFFFFFLWEYIFSSLDFRLNFLFTFRKQFIVPFHIEFTVPQLRRNVEVFVHKIANILFRNEFLFYPFYLMYMKVFTCVCVVLIGCICLFHSHIYNNDDVRWITNARIWSRKKRTHTHIRILFTFPTPVRTLLYTYIFRSFRIEWRAKKTNKTCACLCMFSKYAYCYARVHKINHPMWNMEKQVKLLIGGCVSGCLFFDRFGSVCSFSKCKEAAKMWFSYLFWLVILFSSSFCFFSSFSIIHNS